MALPTGAPPTCQGAVWQLHTRLAQEAHSGLEVGHPCQWTGGAAVHPRDLTLTCTVGGAGVRTVKRPHAQQVHVVRTAHCRGHGSIPLCASCTWKGVGAWSRMPGPCGVHVLRAHALDGRADGHGGGRLATACTRYAAGATTHAIHRAPPINSLSTSTRLTRATPSCRLRRS